VGVGQFGFEAADTGNAAVREARGDAYAALKKYDPAYDDYRRAYQIDSTRADARAKAGHVALLQGNWKSAAELLSGAQAGKAKLVTVSSDIVDAWLLQARRNSAVPVRPK